jgi:hypothetical protein
MTNSYFMLFLFTNTIITTGFLESFYCSSLFLISNTILEHLLWASIICLLGGHPHLGFHKFFVLIFSSLPLAF